MTATEARTASKAIGNLLRKAREEKHLTVYAASGLCCLNIAEVVRLEIGNLSKFHQNPDLSLSNLTNYARALGVDLSLKDKSFSDMPLREISAEKKMPQNQDDAELSIPFFLRKMR
jgi:cytoskeletal protein RodZ